MPLRIVVAVVSAALLASSLGACGDDSDSTIANATPGSNAAALTATASARGSGTPSGTAGSFGPAPTIDGNIEAITPAHAASVTQASTRSPNPTSPHGVCVSVNFKDPVQNLQWFRMAVDGEEVTPKLTIRVDSANPPKGGTLCYAPADGLSVGRHNAGFSVGNPSDLQGKPVQVIGWAFEVTR
jgi:hypothetical protein